MHQQFKVLDSDIHIIEPPDLWQRYIDTEFRDRAPYGLTEDAGTGNIEAAERLGRRGEIPREDVASTFAAALQDENTYHKTFEILSGDTPIPEALARL